MKTRAGWKLKTRKPRAAPTRAAASPTASGSRPAEATSSTIAVMATTPAASPSTPSSRLVVFCMPTIQATVMSRTSRGLRDAACSTGRRRYWILNPNSSTATTATPTWMASFTIAGIPQRSSTTNTAVVKPATISSPGTAGWSRRKTRQASAKAPNMASPPP